jgi:hypothetical protein
MHDLRYFAKEYVWLWEGVLWGVKGGYVLGMALHRVMTGEVNEDPVQWQRGKRSRDS